MGPIWGRQDPGGPRVGPMNFAIWVKMSFYQCRKSRCGDNTVVRSGKWEKDRSIVKNVVFVDLLVHQLAFLAMKQTTSREAGMLMNMSVNHWYGRGCEARGQRLTLVHPLLVGLRSIRFIFVWSLQVLSTWRLRFQRPYKCRAVYIS